MRRAKSDLERLGPGVAEALDGAERLALPRLEVVDGEARAALRVAQDYARSEVYPSPEAAEIKRALDTFDAAAQREGLSDAACSPRRVLSTAVAAALSLASGDAKGAALLGANIRRWVRGEDARASETDMERTLSAYQEAYWALRRGEEPLRLRSGEGDAAVVVGLLGAHRACGGVVLTGPDDAPTLATDWTAAARRSPDPYVRAVASQVERAMVAAARRTPVTGGMM